MSREDEVAGLPRWGFAFPGALRDELTALALVGHKTTTAGLYDEILADGEPVPEPGDREVLLDSDERLVAVIEVLEWRVVPLADVDDRHAIDEGEATRTRPSSGSPMSASGTDISTTSASSSARISPLTTTRSSPCSGSGSSSGSTSMHSIDRSARNPDPQSAVRTSVTRSSLRPRRISPPRPAPARRRRRAPRGACRSGHARRPRRRPAAAGRRHPSEPR
jgi:uncharacterized protein YhfF